ncbi:biopolymer transporter ExbD [Planctomicrobium sp. SH664]|uniref:biopolymer transporter ExbD n=1 Tax=Planctomicrobium sp. SH664 TaxID=3448125 RepID=UPI003F5CADE6
MPIQFRCHHCGQLLSISQRKAGKAVTCPQCLHRTTVPVPEEPIPVGAEDQAGGGLHLVRPASTDNLPVESAWKKEHNPWNDEEEEGEELELSFGKDVVPESGLDMTPMVDVVMLLLIFFMITASFSTQKSLESTAPEPASDGYGAQAISAEDVESDSVVVDIDENNAIRVDDVPVAGVEELVEVLKSKIRDEKKNELLIEAHPQSTHGTVVSVMDAGLAAEMQKIRRSSKRDDD